MCEYNVHLFRQSLVLQVDVLLYISSSPFCIPLISSLTCGAE